MSRKNSSRTPTGEDSATTAVGRVDSSRTLLTDDDVYLFNEGTHRRLYRVLGAHPCELGGETGTFFAVWAPNAERVSLMGDFNDWSHETHPLAARGTSGIWQGFVPGVEAGATYKYRIRSGDGAREVDKADPFAFRAEHPPATGSIVADLEHEWGDAEWMETRGRRQALDAPMSVYEVHLGSWRRVPEDGGRSLTYREAAVTLAEHVRALGFTHVELMPITEHPFYGSWGYQTTGYFAPTARYGQPTDLMAMIDAFHQQGLGVLLDWVPSHFPTDEHGLAWFDGTALFEHADPRQGFHPDWKSSIFNYGRNEIRSFLESSAHFWLDRYHVDGLRVDAVASMLYLDYSRKEGEWIPNEHGGRENLEAIAFLRQLNESAYGDFPGIQMIAEESTAWPMVSRPTWLGGLGFGLKWDMGWMHDTLQYLQREPVHRKYHQGEITFRMIYAFNENFMMPLSHDEVVHGKGSLLGKMPGDEWQRFANLRLLHSWMHAMPGKKLVFMGSELGDPAEWTHDGSLPWHLAEQELPAGLARCLTALNRHHREIPALHERDCEPEGFEWVAADDAENSVVAFLRKGAGDAAPLLAVFNFTPAVRENYRLGVPGEGRWVEVFNSDAAEHGGSGVGNLGAVESSPVPSHGRWHSLNLTLPPLGALFLAPAAGADGGERR